MRRREQTWVVGLAWILGMAITTAHAQEPTKPEKPRSLKPAGRQAKLGDPASGKVIGRVAHNECFQGITWSADGERLYVSGGFDDVIYRFDHADGLLTNRSEIKYPEKQKPTRAVAGNPMVTPVRLSFTAAAASAGVDQLPLLDQSNLKYVGAFRVPSQQFGASSFQYGGSALAYNPANHSLFAVGQPQDQAVAEIAIPHSIVNSTNLGNLAVASVLQPFVKVLPKLPDNPPEMSLGGMEAIGGLMVVNGQLVGTAFNTYDGTGRVRQSHFKLDSLNLASARARGLYQVGNLGGGFVGGYMTQIPTEWHSTLGSSYLTGQAALSIISRTSYGPSAFGFDPNKLGAGVNRAIPYVYYDQNHQKLGRYNSNPPTLFNATVGGSDVTSLNAVFVPQTRSVLFFGSIGTGNYYYGEAADANDPNRPYKGVHSVGGKYAFQVWAYDALDFAAVKKGRKKPWDVKPYSTWRFHFPHPDGFKTLGGVAFDPSTGRFYLSEMKADKSELYANTPLIQVLQLKMPAKPSIKAARSALESSAIVANVGA
ncbi:YncE family protein [Tundrisphaera lichenicola]|uniref:YncE family protein n=1 Tax=Tundrisphaera lichenicola TaxID=2029860 RepID=UPI003EC0E06F